MNNTTPVRKVSDQGNGVIGTNIGPIRILSDQGNGAFGTHLGVIQIIDGVVPAADYRWLPNEIENSGTYPNGSDYRMGQVGEDDFEVFSNRFDPTLTQYFDNDAQASVVTGIEDGFTVSCWVRTINTSGTKPMIQCGGIGAAEDGFRFATTGNGGIQLRSNGINITSPSSTDVNDGIWNYATATYDGTTVKIYKNAVLVHTADLVFNTITATTMKIGANANGNEPFDGELDNLEIWNGVVLTQSQILTRVDFTQAFSTAEINPLVFLSAYDQTTITDSLGDVTQVDNKGTGADFTQTSSTKRFETLVDTVNKVPALFSDTDEGWLEANIDIGTTGNIMALVVAEIDSVQVNLSTIMGIESASENFRLNSATNPDFGGRAQLTIEGENIVFPDPPNAGPSIYLVVFDWDNSEFEAFLDGVSMGTATYANSKLEGASDFRWFQKNSPGSTSSPEGSTTYFVASQDISLEKRFKLEGEYAWIHGITLPSGHPYEDFPPKDTDTPQTLVLDGTGLTLDGGVLTLL